MIARLQDTDGSVSLDVTSAQTALYLLSGQAKPDVRPDRMSDMVKAPSGVPRASGVLPEATTHEIELIRDRLMDRFLGLQSGALSPFDPEATRVDAAFQFRDGQWDSRLKFEGSFVSMEGPSEGRAFVYRDASFPDRQSAMANAYHFGKILSGSSQNLAKYETQVADARSRLIELTAKQANGDLSGDIEEQIKAHKSFIGFTQELAMNERLVSERAKASLANMFSFTSSGVSRQDGLTQAVGFSISHGSLGKIVHFAADGSVRLFDGAGRGYAAAEYNEANVDGGIPELHNDLIRQADRRADPTP